jgi:deoxycytidylate deaminase
MAVAQTAAKQSFDYNMQTGVALARHNGTSYELIATAYNGVVPYQTYAMHHGAARERNFSPMHDLNHYDTNHAEVELILKAQKQKLDLHSTTLFINLLPCPSCARMLAHTDIETFVYREDHSDGYAVKMLEQSGKKVIRLVN